MSFRIVFCGTPDFAVPAFHHLLAQPDFRVEAVITQPDRAAGRGGQPAAPAMKTAALEAGLALHQPAKIRAPEVAGLLRGIAPDAVFIIAYGQIIPRALLEIPRLGWINLHASLLPAYRGAAPVNWAIIRGETQTGITTMRIGAGLDTGPILLQQEFAIAADETAPQLARRLSLAGGPLIVESLRKLDRGEILPLPQDDARASFAPLLRKEDGRIAWDLPARDIYNRIRGLQPWPGAFTTFRGQLCHVWGRPYEAPPGPQIPPASAPGTISPLGSDWLVVCGPPAAADPASKDATRTLLRLDSVQLESRRRTTAREFANGAHLRTDERFGS